MKDRGQIHTGPAAEIKAWAAKINTGAVLGQIDLGR
jgi:hypothetical protein